MLVRFIKGYSPYQTGEVAGFPPEKAEKLIKMKVAEVYQKPDSEIIEPVTISFDSPPVNRMVKRAKKK